MGAASPVDHLQGRYSSTELDHVWTMDQTRVGKQDLLLIQEQSSREIIGYRLYTKPVTAQAVVDLLSETVALHQRPRMLHTDRGGIFTSPTGAKSPQSSKPHPVTSYLESEGIQASICDQSSKKHRNNAHERVNRTIKTKLRSKLKETQNGKD